MRKAPHYIAIDGAVAGRQDEACPSPRGPYPGALCTGPDRKPAFWRTYIAVGLARRSGPRCNFFFARFQRLSETGPGKSQLPVVTDFLFEKDKLYAYLNLDDIEIELYNPYYGFFKQQLPQPDLTVYLKATAESLHARLSAERSGLESRISEAYLDGFVRAYDYFFDRYKGRGHPCR